MAVMSYVVRAIKGAAATTAVTLVGWRVFEALYSWADHAADKEVDSGQPDWFAGASQYLLANGAGWVFLPIALWGLLRLMQVRGNHLAVTASAVAWVTFTAPRLVGSHPSPGAVVACVAVQAGVTAVASAVQLAAMPTTTQVTQ